jgi:hypothetical protein
LSNVDKLFTLSTSEAEEEGDSPRGTICNAACNSCRSLLAPEREE